MPITVQYLTQIRRAIGCSEEAVDAFEGTLAELLQLLAQKHPAAASLLVGSGGQPSRSLLVFVNDAPTDPAAVVPANAIVTLLTPMSGGSRNG